MRSSSSLLIAFTSLLLFTCSSWAKKQNHVLLRHPLKGVIVPSRGSYYKLSNFGDNDEFRFQSTTKGLSVLKIRGGAGNAVIDPGENGYLSINRLSEMNLNNFCPPDFSCSYLL